MPRLCVVLVAGCLLGGAAIASAQPRDGAGQISFGLGGTFGDHGRAVLLDASAGFRVTRHFGLEIDVSAIQDLELSGRGVPVPLLSGGIVGPTGIPIPIIFPPLRVDRSADLRVITTSAFGEFPTPVRSIRVYVLAGGGAANLRQRIQYSFAGSVSGLPAGFPQIALPRGGVGSTTELAFVAGTGVDFQIWRHVAMGVDARYLRITASDADLNLARLGGRVSYRF